MKTTRLIAAFSTLAALSFSPAASAITVDANLADWGLTSNWSYAAGINGTKEDQTGSGAFRLNPGYGGQAYDAELLMTTISNNKLYIALVTGHDPKTVQNPSGNSYGVGDFAIDFGRDNSYEIGININHYLGSNKYENLVQGGVYAVNQWNYGLWDVNGNEEKNTPLPADPTHPTSIKSGTLLGNASLAYKTTGVSGYGSNLSDKHFFYELSIDLSLFRSAGWDGESAFDIHWTQNCANDSIEVTTSKVPEPGSMALLGTALLGLAGLRRRKTL